MKIAVFGDIHGNIEALKAVYDAALALKPVKIYHLGDLGGYASFVNETVCRITLRKSWGEGLNRREQ